MNTQNNLYYANFENSTESVFTDKPLDPKTELTLSRELNNIYNNCKDTNWDKEGAEPISLAAFQQSLKFIKFFPETLELPEILPDNDGYIEFEWYSAPSSISLYVTPSDVILYAVYYSLDNRFSGRFNMNKGIPSWLANQIEELSNA